jgi:hypothetical protein
LEGEKASSGQAHQRELEREKATLRRRARGLGEREPSTVNPRAERRLARHSARPRGPTSSSQQGSRREVAEVVSSGGIPVSKMLESEGQAAPHGIFCASASSAGTRRSDRRERDPARARGALGRIGRTVVLFWVPPASARPSSRSARRVLVRHRRGAGPDRHVRFMGSGLRSRG